MNNFINKKENNKYDKRNRNITHYISQAVKNFIRDMVEKSGGMIFAQTTTPFLLDKIKVLESLNRLKEIESVKRNYIWKKLLIKKDVKNMRRSKDMENLEEKLEVIKYGDTYSKCVDKDCENCSDLEECYSRTNEELNDKYAKSLDYGGFDSAEEFWEQVYN